MPLCGMLGDFELGMVLEKPACCVTNCWAGAIFKRMGTLSLLTFTFVTQLTVPVQVPLGRLHVCST